MKKNLIEEYYNRHYNSLFFYAYSLTKNKSDAEDLVSSAFLKSIVSFTDGNLNAWMYKVIRNEFINKYIKNKRVEFFEDSFRQDASADDLLSDYISQEEKRWLYEQIFLLPLKERQIMILSSYHDLNDQDIADIINITISNVRVIKHRARAKLLKKYKEVWE